MCALNSLRCWFGFCGAVWLCSSQALLECPPCGSDRTLWLCGDVKDQGRQPRLGASLFSIRPSQRYPVIISEREKIRARDTLQLAPPLHGPLLILQQLSPDGHVCKALWEFLFYFIFCSSSSVLLLEDDSWGVWCRHQHSRWLRLCHWFKESLARRRSDQRRAAVKCSVSVDASARHRRDSLFVSLLCFLFN